MHCESAFSDSTIIGNYIIEKKIGSGSFASVYLAKHKLTQTYVAIKSVMKEQLLADNSMTRFHREVSILKKMDHPFISELFEVIETPFAFHLVMEYAQNGSILDYVNTHGRLSEEIARRYFSQIISALDYIHNHHYVAHRDLKAENILLDRYDNIKLIDFGLSKSFTRVSPELNTACGSPAYAAPEMIKGEQYTKAADIWSLGILLYAMVAAQLPFDDQNVHQLLEKICAQEVIYPPFFSRSLVGFLQRILTKNPEQRITIHKIKDDPWFSQSEYSFLMQYQFHDNASWRISDPSYIIDREIVEQLNGYGLDTRMLPSMLLNSEYTALTAAYRQKRKQKITEQMKDLMINMQKVPFSPRGVQFLQTSNITSSQVSSKHLFPLNNNINPTPNVVRRMSKPVAVRRVVILKESPLTKET